MTAGRIIRAGVLGRTGWWMAAAIAVVCQIASGETIRLKSSAVVEPHQDVRLGDIATISGGSGEKASAELADMVILAGVEKPSKLKAETVLMAVIAQRGIGGPGGSLQIAGSATCDVTFESNANKAVSVIKPVMPAAGSVTGANALAGKAPATAPASTMPATAPAEGTLADVIRARILQEVPAEEMVLSFESISPLLDHPVAAGRKWLCRPLTKSLIGTVQFEAKLVEGARTIEQLNIMTTIKRVQPVVVSLKRIQRGEVITSDAVRVEQMALDRKMTSLFTSDKDVIGLEAQHELEVGTMLELKEFKPAMMAHRNEPVTVYYVAGTLTVQIHGRATGDAKLHERVQIRNESTQELYDATMIARNVAVAGGTLTAEQEAKIREGNP